MKIGCLQFDPRLGDVQGNMATANNILEEASSIPELLVLPELAFTGYNFPNLAAIKPFLEPTAAGPSTLWASATAKSLGCHIIVGYPETCTDNGETRNYNATVTVSPAGQVINHYRKSFLYYTDETWASEGPNGSAQRHVPSHIPFFCGPLPSLHRTWNIGHGICMDINPYRWTAPWTSYEFANCMLQHHVRLVVLSMAWMTRLLPVELEAEPDRPDMETVAYWLERFWPFTHFASGEEIIVVFANRCGMEGSNVVDATDEGKRAVAVQPENGEEFRVGDQVCYAGSSCVMKFHRGGVRMFERQQGEVAIMGKGEEGLLVVDTSLTARYLLQQKTS